MHRGRDMNIAFLPMKRMKDETKEATQYE